MTLQFKNDNGRFIALILLIASLWLMISLKQCNKPVTYTPVSLPELHIKDSFRTVIKYHDSTRIKTVTDHRTVVKTFIKDSTKCYTEIVQIVESCERVIAADSILISSLKANIANDSAIIFKQGLMIEGDSLQICKLNKKLKRQKMITKIALFTGLIGGGALGVKVSN